MNREKGVANVITVLLTVMYALFSKIQKQKSTIVKQHILFC